MAMSDRTPSSPDGRSSEGPSTCASPSAPDRAPEESDRSSWSSTTCRRCATLECQPLAHSITAPGAKSCRSAFAALVRKAGVTPYSRKWCVSRCHANGLVVLGSRARFCCSLVTPRRRTSDSSRSARFWWRSSSARESPSRLWGQLLTFAISSVVLLVFVRPIVVRKLGLNAHARRRHDDRRAGGRATSEIAAGQPKEKRRCAEARGPHATLEKRHSQKVSDASSSGSSG